MKKITLISRNSQLALWQAQSVKAQLNSFYPQLLVEIKGIITEGDRILDRSLEKIGGKGLFIKELEYQLASKEADIAVHSLKDLPANLPPNFSLAAILQREDPADALLSNYYPTLEALPPGSIIGTSSARRIAFLQHYYPHLSTKMLRGNLQTRITKLDNGEYSAIILAVAGLKRLGLATRITQTLSTEQFIPAIGQGALALEICSSRDELLQLLQPLIDRPTQLCVTAEREMGRFLQANCNLPIAGFARLNGDTISLNAMLADSSSGQLLRASASAKSCDYLQVGRSCAQQLLDSGAAAILERCQYLPKVD